MSDRLYGFIIIQIMHTDCFQQLFIKTAIFQSRFRRINGKLNKSNESNSTFLIVIYKFYKLDNLNYERRIAEDNTLFQRPIHLLELF